MVPGAPVRGTRCCHFVAAAVSDRVLLHDPRISGASRALFARKTRSRAHVGLGLTHQYRRRAAVRWMDADFSLSQRRDTPCAGDRDDTVSIGLKSDQARGRIDLPPDAIEIRQ